MASGVDSPGRLILADRYNQRLDLRWKRLKFLPNMELILDRYRQHEGRKVDFTALAGAPPDWRGVMQSFVKSGSIVHAGRFFREQRLLVEVTVLWPARRDVNMEKEILASITPLTGEAPTHLWQAMGLSLTIASDFDLVKSDSSVGRIRWDFARRRKDGPDISVEQIAMYESWLKAPLREWLVWQLPDGYEVVHQAVIDIGPHRAEQLISSGRISRLASVRGIRRRRLDLGWLCPVEGRAYRVSASRPGREQEIALPGRLAVRCCRPPPELAAGSQWSV